MEQASPAIPTFRSLDGRLRPATQPVRPLGCRRGQEAPRRVYRVSGSALLDGPRSLLGVHTTCTRLLSPQVSALLADIESAGLLGATFASPRRPGGTRDARP